MIVGTILLLLALGALIFWLILKVREKHEALKLIRSMVEQQKVEGAVDSVRNVLTSHGY